MKRVIIIAVALLCTAYIPIRQNQLEEAAVRSALEHYLTAHATGVGSHLDGVFHEQGRMHWVNGDTLATRSFPQYIAGFRGQPQPDEAQRKRSIESVDVSGRAAIGKIVLDYPNAKITDYFTLLKFGNEWKVVSKTFYSEPKTK